MEPHLPFSGIDPGKSLVVQQAQKLQDIKYKDHVIKLEEKWMETKKEYEKMTKGKYFT